MPADSKMRKYSGEVGSQGSADTTLDGASQAIRGAATLDPTVPRRADGVVCGIGYACQVYQVRIHYCSVTIVSSSSSHRSPVAACDDERQHKGGGRQLKMAEMG
jgi:hypothetical protein